MYKIGSRLYLAIGDFLLIWRDHPVAFKGQRKANVSVAQVEENWGYPIEKYYKVSPNRTSRVGSRPRNDYAKPILKAVFGDKSINDSP